jgi:predicted metal-binding membrane protein
MSQVKEETAAGPAQIAASATERRVYAACALAFAAALVPVIYFSKTMAGAMPMPGGWKMSMAWMPMSGWATATLMFAFMWLAMMVAMMLPSTLPVVLLFRRFQVFRGTAHPALLSVVLAVGYFLAWSGFGAVAYGGGVVITQLAMRSVALSRAVPTLASLALVLAGLFQLTSWKQSCLGHCRDPLLLVANHAGSGWRGALRLGLHHGAFCIACCWALMLVQLAVGVMNLALMALIALAIAMEKMLPRGPVLARVAGVLIAAAGILRLVHVWVT